LGAVKKSFTLLVFSGRRGLLSIERSTPTTLRISGLFPDGWFYTMLHASSFAPCFLCWLSSCARSSPAGDSQHCG
jgi:hypothetical protein